MGHQHKERAFISARTRAALASAEVKGVKLGGLRPTTAARNATLTIQADAHAARVAAVAQPLRDA